MSKPRILVARAIFPDIVDRLRSISTSKPTPTM
jgi:hypothetical protein